MVRLLQTQVLLADFRNRSFNPTMVRLLHLN